VTFAKQAALWTSAHQPWVAPGYPRPQPGPDHSILSRQLTPSGPRCPLGPSGGCRAGEGAGLGPGGSNGEARGASSPVVASCGGATEATWAGSPLRRAERPCLQFCGPQGTREPEVALGLCGVSDPRLEGDTRRGVSPVTEVAPRGPLPAFLLPPRPPMLLFLPLSPQDPVASVVQVWPPHVLCLSWETEIRRIEVPGWGMEFKRPHLNRKAGHGGV
jgi:hypothetical protein